MVRLIMGANGAGKTKQLIELIHAAVESENGSVVSIVVMNGISEGNALNILKSEGFTMRKVCGPT